MPSFEWEDQAQGLVVGIDEVGRGPWAGPVVACAFAFQDRHILGEKLAEVGDSKKVSAAKREFLFDLFHHHKDKGCLFALGVASVEEIDALNIREASLLAMARAYEALQVNAELVLVDGNALPKLPVRALALVKGDQLSYSIAAASIIAKVVRDRNMAELAKVYPHYGWEKNAGYGTQKHQQGLQTHGITIHHRRSFAPIRKIMNQAA